MAAREKKTADAAGAKDAKAQECPAAGEPAEILERVAAIDVAKATGMVCTRVPHDTRAGRRVQKTWNVRACYAGILELAGHLICQGIQRVVLESTSDYWRIWSCLLESRGLQVWLVSARDVRNVPGRPKTGKLDAIWLCKLNERGMLRASFVPPGEIRQLRGLTRLRASLTEDMAACKKRAEKVLEDSLVKMPVAVTDIFGVPGRAMLDDLISGQRDPKVLAQHARGRMRAKTGQLEELLAGRFTDEHGYLIATLLTHIDALQASIDELTGKIEEHIAARLPLAGPVCTACGVIGEHAPGCAGEAAPLLPLLDRLDEIPGIGRHVGQVLIAEPGTGMSVFPTAGHLASWAKMTPRTIQSGASIRHGRTGKGNPWLRSALGDAAMAAGKTQTHLGDRHRSIRHRRGTQKALVATGRGLLEIARCLISDPAARYTDLGVGYRDQLRGRDTTTRKIRELERANPGMKVTLTPISPAAPPDAAGGTANP